MSARDPSRILLLGAAGFIGQHLLRELRNRFPLVGIDAAGDGADRLAEEPGLLRWTAHVPALLKSLPKAPEVVYWAIGGASVGASVRAPQEDYQRSVPPLVALLDQLSGPWSRTHLVFLSSAAVYGRHGSAATPTTTPPAPISPYGEHKRLSEQMIRSFDPDGRRSHILRPFSVYGPGLRRQLFWDALEKGRRGEHHFDGAGGELRDWLYVGDLVSLLADISTAPARFPALLNAGTGEGRSVAEVLGLLHRLGGMAAPPDFLGLARAGDPDQLVACPVEQRTLSAYLCTPLVRGLSAYLDWYRRLAP